MPYKDKVSIIKKWVASTTDNDKITLDDYFTSQKVNFVKMDVEGSETDVLAGMKNLLKQPALKLAITAYHNQNDEQNILRYMDGFEVTRSDGFLLCGWEFAEPPFFRTGVIRAITLPPPKKMTNIQKRNVLR